MKNFALIFLLLIISHPLMANDVDRAKDIGRCYKMVIPPNVFTREDYSDLEYSQLAGLKEHFKKQAKVMAGQQWELVSFMALAWAEGVVSTHQYNGEQLHDYRDWVLESCRSYYGSGGFKHVRLKDSHKLMVADTDSTLFN
ncbi:hypothetical protein [Photobacterium minamisatsumaniensis]|uniref:hypothetical protein n=1 Tax=Photobacterium minamisatsumaniensis TaxID=2910233 RepID=UPI003D0E0026